VIARSDDLELIEINMPAEYGTRDLGGATRCAQPSTMADTTPSLPTRRPCEPAAWLKRRARR
jgi:hypothetical protein